MGIWGNIIAYTQQSPTRLIGFGTICVGATWVVGSVFSNLTAGGYDEKQHKARMQELPVDGQRFARAQSQRLAQMVKDVAEGKDEDHWNAAMRGTILPHPLAESKTQGIDSEKLARQSKR